MLNCKKYQCPLYQNHLFDPCLLKNNIWRSTAEKYHGTRVGWNTSVKEWRMFDKILNLYLYLLHLLNDNLQC